MAIKLQNNFTTPEQSKRLLELGVPADSADCYIYEYDKKWASPLTIIQPEKQTPIVADFSNPKYLPIWSVGRLIEIYITCKELEFAQFDVTPSTNLIQDILDRYKLSIGVLDFSKWRNDYE